MLGWCADACGWNIPTLKREESGLELKKVSLQSKIFASVVLAEVAFLSAIAIIVYQSSHSREANAYASTWCVGALALAYLLRESVLREDAFLLWAGVASHMAVPGYALYIEFNPSSKANMPPIYANRLSVIVAIVTSAMQVALIVSGYFAADSFVWYLYKRVGGDRRLLGMYKTYNVFVSVLKLDFIIAVVVLVLASFLVLGSLETLLDVIACVVSFVALICGYYGVREESRLATSLFGLFLLVLPTYIIVKLVQLQDDPYFGTILIAGCWSLSVRSFLFYRLYRAVQNFGLGLRDTIFVAMNSARHESKDSGFIDEIF